MMDLPIGTVTFLFTDIEGSTHLWEQYPDGMKASLARHDLLLRQAVENSQGIVVKTTGDGMMAVFITVTAALKAAVWAQQVLLSESWDEIQPRSIRVRMAIHTGAAELRAGDYFGTAVNRAARLMAAAHGGQVLISDAAADLAREELPDGVTLLDLGEHRLKDLSRPAHVFQMVHPELARDFPPLVVIDSFPNNLPQQLTSFVGREKELDQTRSRLENARLLTLIGPGGTGKTRLTIQLAADILPGYSDGVWLIELASLSDPGLVVQTVASVLNVREVQGLTLLELLTNYLRSRRLLLLMDNCEHLIEACANLADNLLRACPRLQIIASSREALGIDGELIYRVPPLALPGEAERSPENLSHFEAVQLFIERAQAVQPNFAFTALNAPAVAQISRRLDGIPLALELAAARVRMLPPEQIASHLDDRFRLLTGGSRTALPRQQTLRSLIDWSYDLLSESERTLFRRLAVFVGGWSLEAAEAISPDLDVWTLLDALVNKSLVAQEEVGGAARFRLLETIRQYARDRLLESTEGEEVRQRHFRYYYEFIDPSQPHTIGWHTRDWYEKVNREKDNLSAALQWGISVDPDAALWLASGMADFWIRRGYFDDARSWLRATLQRVEDLPEVQGEVQKNRDLARAKALLGLSLPSLTHDSSAVVMCLECVRIFRQYDTRADLGFALGMLGFNEALQGDLDHAEEHFTEAISIGYELNDPSILGFSLGVYSMYVLTARGDLEAAKRASEEGAGYARQIGPPVPWGGVVSIYILGMFAFNTGHLDEARRYSSEAKSLFEELGDVLMVNNAQSNLGHIELASGNYDAARQIYKQTLPRYLEVDYPGAIAHQLERFAIIAIREEQYERAAILFGSAEALRERVKSDMAVYERDEYTREVDALQGQMPQEAFAAAWAEGRKLAVKQAVDLALQET
jgi:predicted ATPase/class 3 adenylate cyclase